MLAFGYCYTKHVATVYTAPSDIATEPYSLCLDSGMCLSSSYLPLHLPPKIFESTLKKNTSNGERYEGSFVEGDLRVDIVEGEIPRDRASKVALESDRGEERERERETQVGGSKRERARFREKETHIELKAPNVKRKELKRERERQKHKIGRSKRERARIGERQRHRVRRSKCEKERLKERERERNTKSEGAKEKERDSEKKRDTHS
ncbi:hypothetical protein KM043_012780 [Ampulex compressa]|nr:hypothetical protein KM043_012780 [Ampulex compressa]